MLKTRGMQIVEARIGQPLEEYLEEKYHGEGLTTVQIAAALGVDNSTVSRWMAALRIEARYLGPRRAVV